VPTAEASKYSKFTFSDENEQALADLKAKGILVEVEFNGEKHEAYGNGVAAVVELGWQ